MLFLFHFLYVCPRFTHAPEYTSQIENKNGSLFDDRESNNKILA